MFGVGAPPAAGLRFDVPGRADPAGYTETNVDLVASTAVTFNATDATPVTGTPPRPATRTVVDSFGPTAPDPEPNASTVGSPGRVSNRRAGTTGMNPAGGGALDTGVVGANTNPVANTIHTTSSGNGRRHQLVDDCLCWYIILSP